MGVVGGAGDLLNIDAVGAVGKFAACAAEGVILVDHHGGGVGHFLGQLKLHIFPDFCHGLVIHEQAGHPFGGAGFRQGHGQHLPGGRRGAVEHQIHHQAQGCHRQNHHGEQQQEEPADDPTQQAAFFLLFLNGGGIHGIAVIVRHLISLSHKLVPLSWIFAVRRPSAAGS